MCVGGGGGGGGKGQEDKCTSSSVVYVPQLCIRKITSMLTLSH